MQERKAEENVVREIGIAPPMIGSDVLHKSSKDQLRNRLTLEQRRYARTKLEA